MAVFPAVPRDNRLEIYVNSQWVDISADLYARDGLTIGHGSRDEQSSPGPSWAILTLNNRSGNYSPRNPNGSWFGSLGRNTPIRHALGKDKDVFGRTVSNGWGSTDIGFSWSTLGGVAGDYAVTPGVATHSVTATNSTRTTYIPSQLYGDVEVTVDVSLTISSVTTSGGVAAVGPANILVRGIDSSNYLVAYVALRSDSSNYFVDIHKVEGGVSTSLFGETDTGIAHAANTPLRVRALTEGGIVYVKVWLASSNEPYTHQIAYGAGWKNMGWVGVQSYVNSNVSNTLPITFKYSNWTVRVPRFAGEVSYWPIKWDTSGNDVYTTINASGIKRRLGQGNSPLASALYSGLVAISPATVLNTKAYWPCEDGADNSQLSAAVGSYPMNITGTTDFANFTGFLASNPLPTLKIGRWQGKVAPYTLTSGYVTVTYLIHIPTTEPPDNWPISQVFCQGNAPQWEIKYRTTAGGGYAGGTIQLNVWAPSGILYDSGPLNWPVGDGQPLNDHLWLFQSRIYQSGSNAVMIFYALQVGHSVAYNWSITLTNKTVGGATSVVIDPYQKMAGVSIGHINVFDSAANIYDLQPLINGYSGPLIDGGETAGNRMSRLCRNAGVPFAWDASIDDTPLVGPLRPDGLLTVLEDCADADAGILYDKRTALGLRYRPVATLYNQTPKLTLNYTGGQVFAPFEPVDDDQQTRNDVIAKRRDGGQFELYQSAGRLAITDAYLGGVGRYSDQRTASLAFDSQLENYAGWYLGLGTVDESRYPNVTVKLHKDGMQSLDNAALAVGIGDRIQITNPKTGQTPDTIDQIVRGYVETIKPLEHTIVFTCAPAAPYSVLRANATGMMTVDTDGSTLASSATTTATTLSVTSTGTNQRWITGTVNFDIVIEGERITVTNISGTTQTQTFTVTRSVNGIVKAHNAGVVVRLFRPALVAY